MLFDTHAHLLDEAFDADRDCVAALLPSAGVGKMIEVACRREDFAPAVELSSRYPHIYAAAGIHPHHASRFAQGDLDELTRLAAGGRIVAIGEIGLDYHYDLSPREAQIAAFDRQLSLARELNLPVILHIREAFGDCMELLHKHSAGLRGVMHCFSGSAEVARECVDLGLYVAFGGALTFKGAKKPAAAALAVPSDRLLIETDCPYMTPEPYRGRRNDPTYCAATCAFLAALRGVEYEQMAALTYENAMRCFGIR